MIKEQNNLARFIYALGIAGCLLWCLLEIIALYHSWGSYFYDNPVLHQWPLTPFNAILIEILSLIAIVYYSAVRRYFGIMICAVVAHAASVWDVIEIEILYTPTVENMPYYTMIYYALNACWILFYCSILLSKAVLVNRYLLVYALVSLVFLSLSVYYNSRLVYPLVNYLWLVMIAANLVLAWVFLRALINPATDFPAAEEDKSEEE